MEVQPPNCRCSEHGQHVDALRSSKDQKRLQLCRGAIHLAVNLIGEMRRKSRTVAIEAEGSVAMGMRRSQLVPDMRAKDLSAQYWFSVVQAAEWS